MYDFVRCSAIEHGSHYNAYQSVNAANRKVFTRYACSPNQKPALAVAVELLLSSGGGEATSEANVDDACERAP
jgi:hypothetical protein